MPVMNLARLGTQLKLHAALRLFCALTYDCGFKPTLQATNMKVRDMILMCRLMQALLRPSVRTSSISQHILAELKNTLGW